MLEIVENVELGAVDIYNLNNVAHDLALYFSSKGGLACEMCRLNILLL